MLRFYLKKGGWGWNIYHRPTHTYLAGFNTIEDAADFIEEMNQFRPQSLWFSLLFDHKVRMPRRDIVNGVSKDSGWADQERGYETAWKMGTEEFYEQYPDLRIEEKLDYEMIQQVYRSEMDRRAKVEREQRARKAWKSIRRADGRIKVIRA